jgi:hypothetical protein
MALILVPNDPVVRSSLARKAVELVKGAQEWAEKKLSSLGEAIDLDTISKNEPFKLAVLYALAAVGKVNLPINFNLTNEDSVHLLSRAEDLANSRPTFIGRQVCRMAVAYVLGQGDRDWGSLAEHSLRDAITNGSSEGVSYEQIILDWCTLALEVTLVDGSEKAADVRLNNCLTVLENQVQNVQKEANSPISRVMLPIFYAAAAQVLIDIDPLLALSLASQGLENIGSLKENFPHDRFLEVYLEALTSIQTAAKAKLVPGY